MSVSLLRIRVQQKGKLACPFVALKEKTNIMLCFLAVMNLLQGHKMEEQEREILSRYVLENNIRRKDITTYAHMFPDKSMRTVIESEVI